MKRKTVRTVALLAILAASAWLMSHGLAKGNKSITDSSARIVRGSNNLPCRAQAIGQGNRPPVAPDEDLTNLSVSCSDNRSVSYLMLTNALPHPHGCGTTLGELRNARKDKLPGVTLVADPTPDNPYHCILDNLTPQEFVRAITWQQ